MTNVFVSNLYENESEIVFAINSRLLQWFWKSGKITDIYVILRMVAMSFCTKYHCHPSGDFTLSAPGRTNNF